MTLVVDFEDFADAVRRYGREGDDTVYFRRSGSSVHWSYLNPDTGVHVACFYRGDTDEAKSSLMAQGLKAKRGLWVTEASLEHLEQLAGETYVAAVAYETKEGPGLWMDAYSAPPTDGMVLRAIFDEFVSEGRIAEDQFDVFLAVARPTVRLLGPEQIERFQKQKPKEKGGLQ